MNKERKTNEYQKFVKSFKVIQKNLKKMLLINYIFFFKECLIYNDANVSVVHTVLVKSKIYLIRNFENILLMQFNQNHLM